MSKTTKQQEADSAVEMRFLEGVQRRTPQNSLVLKALGDLYTRTGSYHKGLDIDRTLSEMCPDESCVWYNLACSHALVGDKDQAFEALDRAVELGYSDKEWMESDSDLKSIHNDPRFKPLLARISDTD